MSTSVDQRYGSPFPVWPQEEAAEVIILTEKPQGYPIHQQNKNKDHQCLSISTAVVLQQNCWFTMIIWIGLFRYMWSLDSCFNNTEFCYWFSHKHTMWQATNKGLYFCCNLWTVLVTDTFPAKITDLTDIKWGDETTQYPGQSWFTSAMLKAVFYYLKPEDFWPCVRETSFYEPFQTQKSITSVLNGLFIWINYPFIELETNCSTCVCVCVCVSQCLMWKIWSP